MIPKTIHYIWFGSNPLTPLMERCLESWSRHCPDYEIRRWDESNFDVNCNQYCREAYDAKMWAFASDYARLWVLVNYGGIYMDADVEFISSLDEFLDQGAFLGFESPAMVSTGIMACEAGHPFFKALLVEYDKGGYVNKDGSYDPLTNVVRVTQACLKQGFEMNGSQQTIGDLTLYPSDVFCPKDLDTNLVNITENTRAIHHFDGSWVSGAEKSLVEKKWAVRKKHPRWPIGMVKVVSGLLFFFETGNIFLLVDMVKRYWAIWRAMVLGRRANRLLDAEKPKTLSGK